MLVMRRSSSLRWLQFTVKIDLLGEVHATPIVSQAVPVRLPNWPVSLFQISFIESLSSTFCRSESVPNQPKRVYELFYFR